MLPSLRDRPVGMFRQNAAAGANPAGKVPPARIVEPANLVATIGFLPMIAFVFLMFGRPADFFLPWLHLPLALSILSLGAAVLSGQIITAFKMRTTQLMVVLTVWMIICVPFSSYRFGSLMMLSDKWARTFFCFVIMISLVTTVRQAIRMQMVVACSMLMASFLAVAFGIAPYGRIMLPVGLLTGPNDVATVMLFGLLLWLFKFSSPFSSGWMRVVALAAMCPLGYVLLKTASRGAMVTLFVVALLLLFRLPAAQKIGMLSAVGALLITAAVVLPPELKNRYFTLFTTSDQEEFVSEKDEFQQGDAISSTGGRLYLLQRSIEFTFTHPLFGVGPEQFPNADDIKIRADGGIKGTWHGTHNTYTQFSSETGIPGLVIFIAILASAFREIRFVEQNAKRFKTRLAAEMRYYAGSARTILVAQCIFWCFEHSAYMPFWPALLSLGLVLSKTFRQELPRMEAEAAAEAAAAAAALDGKTDGKAAVNPRAGLYPRPLAGRL